MDVKTKKQILLILIIPLLFFSCELFDILPGTDGNFWAMDNSRNGASYRVNADLVVEGTHCKIWLEKGSNLQWSDVKKIADVFDKKIYPNMIDYFSPDAFIFEGIPFNNTLEFADWLVNGDGKLCILLLDIRDNYEEGVNDAYVAGYFSSYDLYSGIASNRRAMIYIDINQGIKGPKGVEEVYRTIAHETQHLMNYAARVVKSNPRSPSVVDTWLDEGLSSAAEYIFMKEHSTDRYEWFFNNGTASINGLIDRGNNFYVWGNRRNENVYALLDDYATVYMFFQWLRLQTGDFSVYKKIISSDSNNYNAVLDALNHDLGAQFDWRTLLKTWHAANYINADKGLYGYWGENEFRNRKIPVMPEISKSVQLFSGEGVYSLIDKSSQKPQASGNIRYTSLIVDSASVDDSGFEAGNILLTYNTSTNISSSFTETGITTGTSPSQGINLSPHNISIGRSLVSAPLTIPLRVGAGE